MPTLAPSSARRRAIPAPMPRLLPVTRLFRSLSRTLALLHGALQRALLFGRRPASSFLAISVPSVLALIPPTPFSRIREKGGTKCSPLLSLEVARRRRECREAEMLGTTHRP